MNVIRLHELCKDVPENQEKKEHLLKKLQIWGLIPDEGLYLCPKCNGLLKLHNASDRFVLVILMYVC